MSRIDAGFVADLALFLDSLDTEGCSTEEAQRRVHQLRSAHPRHRVDLASDTEPYDGRVTYDVVGRQDNDVSVSIAVSSGPGLPWPLRGVVRAAEHDLLRVGPVRLTVSDALTAIDFIWDDRSLLTHLVDACIVGAALDAEPVELDAEAVQEAANAFRRAKGLLSAADTRGWLRERSLSVQNFGDLVRQTAATAELRRRVTGPVDRWFAEHHAELAVVVAAWAAPPQTGGDDAPWDIAADPTRAVAAALAARRPAGIERWRVGNLPPGLVALGDAAPGDVVAGEVEGVAVEALVLVKNAAVLDEATRRDIEQRLFEEWLAERRRTADIEWLWGNASRTSRVS